MAKKSKKKNTGSAAGAPVSPEAPPQEAPQEELILEEEIGENGEKLEPLDDPNFVAAMEKRNITPETMDATKRDSCYRAFTQVGSISEKLHTLYKEKFFGQMGVNVSEREFNGAVKEYLEGRSFEEPREVITLAKQSANFAEIPARIAEKEKLLESRQVDHEKISAKLNKAEAEKQALKDEKEDKLMANQQVGPGWWKRVVLGRDKKANEAVIKADYDKKIAKIEGKLGGLKEGAKVYTDIEHEVGEMKDSLSRMKSDLFSKDFGPLQKTVEIAKGKIKERVIKLVGGGGAGIKEAQTLIKGLDQMKSEGMLSDQDVEDMQKDLDTAIEQSIAEGVTRKVEVLIKENRAFTKLEKTILGLAADSGKKYDNVKLFLIQILEGLQPKESYKKIYVGAILEKLKKDAYKGQLN